MVWPGTSLEVGRMQSLVELCKTALTEILEVLLQEFGMPLIDKVVFPVITNNFYISRF
jgi:hypothetical protein